MRSFIQKLGRFWGSLLGAVFFSVFLNVGTNLLNFFQGQNLGLSWFGIMFPFVFWFAWNFYNWEKPKNK